MKEIVGMPGEDTAYRDPKVRKGLLRNIRSSLRPNLIPGETVLGFFVAYRIRRSVSALIVTDRRLLTLGDVSVGMPVVDELDRSEVSEVHIERHKVFSTGAVVATTPEGEVGLGTLDYGNDTFNKLEEVLRRRDTTGMPLIPTPGGPGQYRREYGEEYGREGASAGYPVTDTTAPQHPLVAQLRALADLHERGALNDQEFASAKEKLLSEP